LGLGRRQQPPAFSTACPRSGPLRRQRLGQQRLHSNRSVPVLSRHPSSGTKRMAPGSSDPVPAVYAPSDARCRGEGRQTGLPQHCRDDAVLSGRVLGSFGLGLCIQAARCRQLAQYGTLLSCTNNLDVHIAAASLATCLCGHRRPAVRLSLSTLVRHLCCMVATCVGHGMRAGYAVHCGLTGTQSEVNSLNGLETKLPHCGLCLANLNGAVPATTA
jgi:hypothetical protein